MTCACPTCGATLPIAFRFDAEAGIVVGNGHAAALSAREAALFQTLNLTPGRVSDRTSLMGAIYGLEAGDDPDQKIIDVMVCKVRKKLQPLGVKIETIHGRGWRLVPQEEARS